MYKNLKIICVICARGGSKGLPRKNIKKLCGKPLIYYTLDVAKKCEYIDDIIVSTEDDEIAKIVEDFGIPVPYKRPKELALDTTEINPVIRHAVLWAKENLKKNWDIIINLSVTCPLRNVEDLKKSIETFVDNDYENLFTVTESINNPYFNIVEWKKDGKIRLVKELRKHIYRRQDAPRTYDQNGSIFLYKWDVLMNKDTEFNEKTGIYVMPRERSIDIDDLFDFKLVEFIIKEKEDFSEQ
ncbi:MAG: acylneuraminate cytidylyltransferase family protein [Candidatus Helarchaeota archaeon]